MKRTQSINLERMRKRSRSESDTDAKLECAEVVNKKGSAKPIAVSLAATTLVACGSNTQEAIVYQDVKDCSRDNPELAWECESAYQKAVAESLKSGPKYANEQECTAEFGRNNCVPYSHYGYDSGNNWFVPLMAGFMFSQVLNSGGGYGYYSSPLYTSYSRHSPYYGNWSSVDGRNYGKRHYGKVTVSKKAFEPKPAVTKTMSRGGFGSKVAAKSNWGGSSSRSSSWGG